MEKEEDSDIITPFIIIFIAIIGLLLLGYISITALDDNDNDYGFIMMLACLFFVISLSFGLSKKILKYYFWSIFAIFTLSILYISYDDSNFLGVFLPLELILIFIFGIYYILIEKKINKN
ncbi:hypothetical protein I2486_12545 [Cellulophaga sp. E16_2]|uniref:hypothetical protein n=1 Tax=Cellulophaga sp. E16_2 TaxID=2789297 RepID=UPI001A91170D|nr:hypothetical protein [Cellulophaga sp. E16_2]MBO0592229.1 hypothetical protein [Cellulophaga sp. E16_2]